VRSKMSNRSSISEDGDQPWRPSTSSLTPAGDGRQLQQKTTGQSSLPVFVFPTSITFYARDRLSYKQVLTLYNPYDFTLYFQVLSTKPDKYNVTNSEGRLKPRNCIDIVIRHKCASDVSQIGVTDKFRIHVQEVGYNDILGKKDISATLAEISLPDTTEDDEPSFAALTSSFGGTSQHLPRSNHVHFERPVAPQNANPNYWLIVIALACIAGLTLPTQGEKQSTNSFAPDYLHLTTSQKLVAAYILGLITMSLLRS